MDFSETIADAKVKADTNDDGKIDFEDVKNGLEDFGDMMSDAGQHIGNTVDDMRDRMFGGDK